MEQGLSKNEIITALVRSPHGKLDEYVSLGKEAALRDPEFLARLIAWNRIRGQIRDSKVALPVVSISEPTFPDELADNSLAHLALLSPRDLLRAYRFVQQVRAPGRMRACDRLIHRYLASKESSGFDRIALQHRKSLIELYALSRASAYLSQRSKAILFHKETGKNVPVPRGQRLPYPQHSVFQALNDLKHMSPQECASTILTRKIPFLVAAPVLGPKMKDPDVVLALIEQMSATELVTNTKMLDRLGVKTNPALRAAYEEGLKKVAASKKNILKTTRAAAAIEEEVMDDSLVKKLQAAQEKQIQASGGIEGNWLVLADRSPSSKPYFESSRIVAATLAKFVKGSVWLVFFSSDAVAYDVTGKDYEAIRQMTRFIVEGGGTSIGVGLDWAIQNNIDVDGIAIVSDAKENTAPLFTNRYEEYRRKFYKEPAVYLYRFHTNLTGGTDVDLKLSMERAGLSLGEFDMAGVDYYSIPNLVQTMRTNRYSLIDEIMNTPLLALNDVLPQLQKKGVPCLTA